jgi:hypothetical protein
MINTTTQQQQLAAFLQKVTDFCVTRGQNGGKMFVGNSRAQIFRYVAFCNLTGRLNVRVEKNEVTAVGIMWPDWQERIEAKAELKMPQFEWAHVHRGDSIFVAEVIGNRYAVRDLYQGFIEAYPHLLAKPMFTMRHGKLVRLAQHKLERFLR